MALALESNSLINRSRIIISSRLPYACQEPPAWKWCSWQSAEWLHWTSTAPDPGPRAAPSWRIPWAASWTRAFRYSFSIFAVRTHRKTLEIELRETTRDPIGLGTELGMNVMWAQLNVVFGHQLTQTISHSNTIIWQCTTADNNWLRMSGLGIGMSGRYLVDLVIIWIFR